MKLFKKILIRLSVLVLILVLTELIYTKTYWIKDVHKHADLLDSIAKYEYNTDVLYLSSSSNYFHPHDDTSNTTISKYLNQFFPNLKINAIQKGYMHSGVFYSVLENIPEDAPIKTIILSVNIRSFGAYWLFSDVETAYSAEQLMLKPGMPHFLKKFLLSLDYYDDLSKEERVQQYLKAWKTDTLKFPYFFDYKFVSDWDYALAHMDRFKNPDGSIDLKTTDYACNLIKFYGYNIDSNHIRIKDFDNIVELAKKRHWKLLFHILPVDMNNAYALVGKEIPFLLNESANYIYNRYLKQGYIVNNLELLNERFFFEDYPTEHYIKEGKLIVAESIAQELKKIYPQEYNDPNYKINVINITPKEISEEAYKISQNEAWMRAIEQKSEKQNRKSEFILREDAYWAIKQRMIQEEITKMILNIKSDSIWLQSIKEKAKKNNLSENEQINLDAKWIINHRE